MQDCLINPQLTPLTRESLTCNYTYPFKSSWSSVSFTSFFSLFSLIAVNFISSLAILFILLYYICFIHSVIFRTVYFFGYFYIQNELSEFTIGNYFGTLQPWHDSCIESKIDSLSLYTNNEAFRLPKRPFKHLWVIMGQQNKDWIRPFINRIQIKGNVWFFVERQEMFCLVGMSALASLDLWCDYFNVYSHRCYLQLCLRLDTNLILT